MQTIKDCLGRDIVVYNHSESFDAFMSAIRKAVCKACDIPEKLLKDAEWTNPHYFGFISPVREHHSQPKTACVMNEIEMYIDGDHKKEESVDIFVSDDQEIIYKFTEDKKANSNGACHEHCDLYYFLDCEDIKTKDGVTANEICIGGGYFKEV